MRLYPEGRDPQNGEIREIINERDKRVDKEEGGGNRSTGVEHQVTQR